MIRPKRHYKMFRFNKGMTMRNMSSYVRKYGAVEGPRKLRYLQQKSSASAKLARQRKKLGV